MDQTNMTVLIIRNLSGTVLDLSIRWPQKGVFVMVYDEIFVIQPMTNHQIPVKCAARE